MFKSLFGSFFKISQRLCLQVVPRVLSTWRFHINNEQSRCHMAFQHAMKILRPFLLTMSPPLLSANASILQIISHASEAKSPLLIKKKKERNFMINWGFQNLRFIYSLWKIILRNFNLQCIKSLPERTLEGIEYTFTSFSLENSLWLCFKIQTRFYIRQRVKRKQIKYQEWYCQWMCVLNNSKSMMTSPIFLNLSFKIRCSI